MIKPGEVAGGETNATTKVSITVHDVNDNSPQFADTVYHASVQENTPRGVPLTVTTTIKVSDMDQVGHPPGPGFSTQCTRIHMQLAPSYRLPSFVDAQSPPLGVLMVTVGVG